MNYSYSNDCLPFCQILFQYENLSKQYTHLIKENAKSCFQALHEIYML